MYNIRAYLVGKPYNELEEVGIIYFDYNPSSFFSRFIDIYSLSTMFKWIAAAVFIDLLEDYNYYPVIASRSALIMIMIIIPACFHMITLTTPPFFFFSLPVYLRNWNWNSNPDDATQKLSSLPNSFFSALDPCYSSGGGFEVLIRSRRTLRRWKNGQIQWESDFLLLAILYGGWVRIPAAILYLLA